MVYPKKIKKENKIENKIEQKVYNLNNYERNVIMSLSDFYKEARKVFGTDHIYSTYSLSDSIRPIDKYNDFGIPPRSLIIIHHSKKMEQQFPRYRRVIETIEDWCEGGFQEECLENKEDRIELLLK